MRRLALILFIFFLQYHSFGQVCSTLGQTPGTAFPVCGTDTFYQGTVPNCGGALFPDICKGDGLSDMNPFYYTFTCFSTGTLGFLITPLDLGDDYDWQIFDITGVSPTDIFTNSSLNVAYNWSGVTGLTGASPSGTSLFNCGGVAYPPFSAMPTLIQGHKYLLMISHFNTFKPGSTGYKLSFNGGSASITDTTKPAIKGATAICDGEKMVVFLSKKMKCNSLAANGSDFTLSPLAANVIGAIGNNCAAGFDLDTVYLSLDKPLAPGKYTILAKVGSDGNTLLDNCANGIMPGDSANVVVKPVIPTLMDSASFINCNPQKIFLFFKTPIYCNSIAADGSDFILSGPSSVNVVKATPLLCLLNPILGATFATGIELDLSAPLFNGGTYILKLVKGTDGNTLINECDLPIALNSTLNIKVDQSVSATINLKVNYGCKIDSVSITHNGAFGVNQWQWIFDSTIISSTENNMLYYKIFGTKTVKLYVTNGFCSDSSSLTYTLPTPNLKAVFTAPDFACPSDTIQFINSSIGNIQFWDWDFSNGQTSILQNPPAQMYPPGSSLKYYPVRLSVTDSIGCSDTTYKAIQVAPNCYIAVPSAFTPNGDGLNDYLYPLNAYKATNLLFRVFNRYGQMIFETRDWTIKWDGTFKNIQQPSGTYVWTLDFTEPTTGLKISQKGTTVLLR